MTKIFKMPFLKPKTKSVICKVIFVLTLFAMFCIIGGLESYSISPLQAVSYIFMGFLIMAASGLKGGIIHN